MPRLSARVMYAVKSVVVEECQNSQYIRPLRLSYLQDGKQKKWDIMKTHDSVAVLIHHVEHNSLIFVKQFRPAVFFNRAYSTEGGMNLPPPGTTIDGDIQLGFTIELCAGIVDKRKTLEQIAAEEVYEECGYRVAAKQLEKITSFRSGIGTTGAEQTIFYAEVTEAMKETAGGGIDSEMIEVMELSVPGINDFIYNESFVKPAGCLFACIWFLREKYKMSLRESIRSNLSAGRIVFCGVCVFSIAIALGIHKYN